MEELKWITSARYLNDYNIELSFNDGVIKTVDLRNHLDGNVFKELKKIDKFKDFYVSDWTITWKNGADMSPEFLYNL